MNTIPSSCIDVLCLWLPPDGSQGFDGLEYVLKFHIELMEHFGIGVLQSQGTANFFH